MKKTPSGIMKKILITKEGKKFYVKDTSKDYHCQFGYVKAEDLKKRKVVTNTGKEMYVIKPTFKDKFKKIKRGAQIIPLKDIGTIITETGINNKTTVVDAGSGSGALALYIAKHAKKVYSYDIREDHLKIARKNKQYLGLKNIEFNNHNVYENIPVKSDVVILDLPEPWEAIKSVEKSLRPGGYVVSYSPTIPQTADFVNNLSERFIHERTIEIILRNWEIDGRKVRPRSKGIGHSGFISISRKIR